MAQKKTRLQRKPVGGMKNSRLELPKSMKELSNAQVEAYAKTKGKDPIAVAIRKAALAEVARRNRILKQWEKGGVAAKKKPLFELPKPKELPREAIKEIRKGVGFLGKAISGELAREMEEELATAGMTPAEKKAWKTKRVAAEKKRLAEEKREFEEMQRLGFGG